MDQHEHEMEVWKTGMQNSGMVFQQINMQGQAAIKAALMINGGASVAMLAFIGTALNNGTDSILLLKLCFSMAVFIAGVLSVAVASGVTYLTGLVNGFIVYTDHLDKKKSSSWIMWGWIINAVAIILVIIGYVLFAIGSINAYCAFTNSLS